METKSNQPPKTISVLYRSRLETKEDRDFARVAKDMGKKAIEHHLSRGRSIVFLEDGKIVRMRKNNRKTLVKA